LDRDAWLAEMRRKSELKYDTIWAPHYGEKFGVYPNATHLQFLQKFMRLLPGQSMILDAACGAGRYFPLLLQTGRIVTGVDQSRGMLERARSRYPNVKLEKIRLQELPYRDIFDGAICMDAMENICPEDWPLVLGNLCRAVKPRGFLYFTVEMLDDLNIKKAYLQAKKAGLPVILGEWPDETCYHYYPSLQLVRGWILQAGLEIMEETEGDGYHHFIVRRAK
jgi:SAM-dependent methyltransferase